MNDVLSKNNFIIFFFIYLLFFFFVLTFYSYTCVKLRLEIGYVSKRQQPDQKAENRPRPPKGLQHSEKIPHTLHVFNFAF